MTKIYTTSWCPYCRAAKRYLVDRGLEFEEISIEEEGMGRDQLWEITGGRTVPQIIIDGNPIGGYEDLLAYDQAGRLTGKPVKHFESSTTNPHEGHQSPEID